jgi:nicotinamide riboside kinase
MISFAADNLITVCSYCKRGVDNNGLWRHLRKLQRYEVESHGICPVCMTTHFPEIASRIMGENSHPRQVVSPKLRVAVSGSECTGKTTLSSLLSQELRFPFIEDVKLFYTKETINPQQSNATVDSALEFRIIKENHEHMFIADRSTVDFWVYASLLCSSAPIEWKRRFHNRAKSHATDTYDLALFLPHNSIPFVENGCRTNDDIFRKRTADLIFRTYMHWGIHAYNIEANDPEERLREALWYIETFHETSSPDKVLTHK